MSRYLPLFGALFLVGVMVISLGYFLYSFGFFSKASEYAAVGRSVLRPFTRFVRFSFFSSLPESILLLQTDGDEARVVEMGLRKGEVKPIVSLGAGVFSPAVTTAEGDLILYDAQTQSMFRMTSKGERVGGINLKELTTSGADAFQVTGVVASPEASEVAFSLLEFSTSSARTRLYRWAYARGRTPYFIYQEESKLKNPKTGLGYHTFVPRFWDRNDHIFLTWRAVGATQRFEGIYKIITLQGYPVAPPAFWQGTLVDFSHPIYLMSLTQERVMYTSSFPKSPLIKKTSNGELKAQNQLNVLEVRSGFSKVLRENPSIYFRLLGISLRGNYVLYEENEFDVERPHAGFVSRTITLLDIPRQFSRSFGNLQEALEFISLFPIEDPIVVAAEAGMWRGIEWRAVPQSAQLFFNGHVIPVNPAQVSGLGFCVLFCSPR